MQLTYTSGDFISGAQLFHTLAVRLSGGLDLLAPSTASPAAVAASVQLTGKQMEVGRVEGARGACCRVLFFV